MILLTEAQCHHCRPLPTCQPRPTCYCTVKKIAKETAFSHSNQPEKHHHGIFSHVLAKNGVSWQLNINKSHNIQFPCAVMPSEPMTIAGLSESLPPAKISMSAVTAHGGSFSSLFW
jgi:hypothetical protein